MEAARTGPAPDSPALPWARSALAASLTPALSRREWAQKQERAFP
jgi:hypothetical protein